MRRSTRSPFFLFSAVLGLVLAMVAGSTAVFAQGTPAADDTAMHPAHIHAGMCPEPGEVVFPLENVVPSMGDATDTSMATPDAMSSPAADTAMTDASATTDDVVGMESTTTVEASLDDILADAHAINVHMSPEQMDLYIACGDIVDEAEDGELVIELEELNDSGVSGDATLTDNGDGTTTVVIQLRHVNINEQGTPESTPLP